MDDTMEGGGEAERVAHILMLLKKAQPIEYDGGAPTVSPEIKVPKRSWLPVEARRLMPTAPATPPATPMNSTKSSNTTPSPAPEPPYLPPRSSDNDHCFINQINLQQQTLLRDPRAAAQLQWFKRIEDTKPPTYYSQLAPIGIHILEEGKAAQTNSIPRDADFLVGNCKELEQWLINGTGDKLVLLRDEEWLNTRPTISGSEMFEELQARTINKDLLLEVQELGKEITDYSIAAQRMTIHDTLERWAVRDQSKAPINLLNLMCRDDGYQPWPLTKHCNLLNRAAASAASTAHSAKYSTALYATAGKESTEVITKLKDLESCMRFQIFGQAGAISTWHMDSIGPYTFVTLEPNFGELPPEHVLKLWAYVRTDHLPEAEQAEIKQQFKQDHEKFRPNPEHIRVLALVAGDTLIMPPGTIHAPITITDCLFRGGMVMQKRQMRRSIRAWRFCADNDQCTNENQPRQSRSILDFFKREVHANPLSCGYEDEKSIQEFERDFKKLAGTSMVCNCKGTCNTKKCGCQVNTQRCGSKCHRGVAKCENPYGCEVDVS